MSSTRAQSARYARNQAEDTGIARINASWRSQDRLGLDQFNQPLNRPLLQRIIMAAALEEVNAIFVANDDTGYDDIVFNSGVNGYGWDLHCGDSETDTTCARRLFIQLPMFPGIKCERLHTTTTNPTKEKWTNNHGARISHTLDCDLFNNMDLVNKLQTTKNPTQAKAVARKINSLIRQHGVENLPPTLGQGLL